MRALFVWLIELYQIHVSPYKGFRCAYGARTGRRSCSAFALAAIQRHGVLIGWLLLRRRFRKCTAAYSRGMRRSPRLQAGDCDCDFPVGDCSFEQGGCDGCDAMDCLPCGGDDDGGDGDGGCTRAAWRKLRRRFGRASSGAAVDGAAAP